MSDLVEVYKERMKDGQFVPPKKVVICDASEDHINFKDKGTRDGIILSASGVYESAGKLHKLHVPEDIAGNCADDHIVSGSCTKDESRFGKSQANSGDNPSTHPAKGHGLNSPAEDHIVMGKSEPEAIKLHHKPIPAEIEEHVAKSHVAFGTRNLPAEGEFLLQGDGKTKPAKPIYDPKESNIDHIALGASDITPSPVHLKKAPPNLDVEGDHIAPIFLNMEEDMKCKPAPPKVQHKHLVISSACSDHMMAVLDPSMDPEKAALLDNEGPNFKPEHVIGGTSAGASVGGPDSVILGDCFNPAPPLPMILHPDTLGVQSKEVVVPKVTSNTMKSSAFAKYSEKDKMDHLQGSNAKHQVGDVNAHWKIDNVSIELDSAKAKKCAAKVPIIVHKHKVTINEHTGSNEKSLDRIFMPIENLPPAPKMRPAKKSFKVSDTVFAYVGENSKKPSAETIRAHKIESRIPCTLNPQASRILHMQDVPGHRIDPSIPAGVKPRPSCLDRLGVMGNDIRTRGPVGGKVHLILG